VEPLPTVVRAEYRGGHRICLLFNDGVESTVDFSDWLTGPIFERLQDPGYFQRFFLDGGTVAWPNGANIAPETLYDRGRSGKVAQGYTSAMPRDSAHAKVVTVDLPDEAFQHRPWSAQEVSQEMRRLWLLEEVRSRRLGFGKAAELSGVPVATFLRLMGEHHIDAFDYDESELDRELSPMS
jgi:predicted HTH domain antitoxin